MQPRHSDIRASIERHDIEITGLRADIHAMRSGLADIQDTMSDIKAFIATSQANKPLPTLEAASRYFGLAQNIGVIIAMVVTGIVYVSSNSNSGEMALLRYKVDHVLQRGTLK